MARDPGSPDAGVYHLLKHAMDALTFATLVTACAPLVHPATAHALVAVESSFNPHAIGVVNGALERQPRSATEAVATAINLQAEGRNFSVGLAQINFGNLKRLGLTIPEAFDACQNLGAMQAILGECYARAGGDESPQRGLRRALSCYYSGNFMTGFRDGYVGRVVTAARRVSAGVRGPP
jgi:type IV secretion system protein VirB1